MSYSKFKDSAPEATVERIRQIYKDRLGLELELDVSKRLEDIYSATLADRQAMWNTSGKGTSEAFCAASAYGESVEHLCNYFAYEIANLSDEANAACGFEKYPDETLMDLACVKTECPAMLSDMHESYSLVSERKADDDTVIELWKEFLGRDRVPFVPYYSVRTGKYVNVPENMVFYLCGSNGGGAGNSPEEAIGHACDEILERYVKYSIYMRGLTPPDVPRSYVEQKCPELLDVIARLEASEGYKVVIKDASMGLGYSVMSVLLIDQKNAGYLVNFGAHPRFEIALERCLTEMLQAFVPGRRGRRKNPEKWTEAGQKRAKKAQNWVTILKDDTGAVPDSYFAGTPSWKFAPWPDYVNYSNRLGMQIQIRQLMRLAGDVYIHDAGYLGFPAYRVYVPGVSTSHIPFDGFQLECFRVMEDFPRMVQEGHFSAEDIARVERTLFSEDTFVNGLIFRSLGESRFHLLHAAACYNLGRYDEAASYLRLSGADCSECLIRGIELERSGNAETVRLLELFYGERNAGLFRAWKDNGAFAAMLAAFEEAGVTFSPRMSAASEAISAMNSLHIRLKQVMMEGLRGVPLEEVMEGSSASEEVSLERSWKA